MGLEKLRWTQPIGLKSRNALRHEHEVLENDAEAEISGGALTTMKANDATQTDTTHAPTAKKRKTQGSECLGPHSALAAGWVVSFADGDGADGTTEVLECGRNADVDFGRANGVGCGGGGAAAAALG